MTYCSLSSHFVSDNASSGHLKTLGSLGGLTGRLLRWDSKVRRENGKGYSDQGTEKSMIKPTKDVGGGRAGK